MGTMVEFKAEVQRVLRLAESKYNVDLSDVAIRYDIRGTTAGQAGAKYRYTNGVKTVVQTKLRFNAVGIKDHWDHLYYETIPHEIAHLVSYFRPNLAWKHNWGWKRLCRELGGTGQTRHSLPLKYAHGTFLYRGTKGDVELSKVRHGKLQRGCTYNFVKYGMVTRNDWIRTGTPEPAYAMAAEAPAAPVATKGKVSRSEAMRIKMREMAAEGKYPEHHVDELVRYGMALGLKTTGAARSCVKGNLKDGRYTR